MELTVFNNEKFGEIKTIEIKGEIWFIGVDIAKALGYANPRNAVPKFVSEEDKQSTQIEYAGQKRTVTIINESGLYSLILSSKLESAKEFKHWVTSEVLPSIRKTGSYSNGQNLITQEFVTTLSNLLVELSTYAKCHSAHIKATNIAVDNLEARVAKLEERYDSYRPLLPMPQISPRDHIIQIVRDYALKVNDFNGSWTKLYRAYAYKTKSLPYKNAKKRNMKIIDYIESIGQIEVLEAIAMDIFCGPNVA